VAEQLELSGEVSFSVRKAHYLCEQARELNAQGDAVAAAKLLQVAMTEAPDAPRPRLLLGQLQLNMGQALQACDTLGQLFEQGSVAAPLACSSLVRAEQARQRYIEHLQKQPSLLAASRWLAGADLGDQATRTPVQKALEQASRPLARYRCAACGFEAKEHFWHCPGCQAWDSYPPRRVEEL
jgi:lipopolysaccharide biosynthesis regulator YciM